MSGLPPAAVRWLANGERGMSSEAIAERMTGVPVGRPPWPDYPRHPRDPDDLRRCRLLLEVVPEWEARLGEMADVSPEWAGLVERWAEVCALMDEEVPDWRTTRTGRAPRTYRLMMDLMREVES